MRTRYSVWMDGRGLDSIDPAITILDIQQQAPKLDAKTAAMGMGDGTRFLRVNRRSLSISVRFAIRELDTVRRADICRRVAAWAKEGYLSTSDRPGQRLHVVCSRVPVVESALKWTQTLQMLFTAYDVPWWEAETPSRASITGASGTVLLYSPGDTESPLDADVTVHGAVSSMHIATGGKEFAFAGLAMQAGDRMTISHDARGILSIRHGSDSVLHKRTADSADELMLSPGSNAITISADASCTAAFSTRGRFA